MHKILFVCHGNICRSPMAEFVMKDLVKNAALEKEFLIDSKATSTEELGNSVHPGTLKKLAQEGIPCYPHKASQLNKSDYQKYDFIIGMDSWNKKNILWIFGSDSEHKVHLLLDFTENARDIADPWYTHDFDATFRDVKKGCTSLLNFIINDKNNKKFI